MPQFDIFINTNQNTRALYPYLVDVQSPLLDALGTRLVIPLLVKTKHENLSMKYLTPTVQIEKKEYLVLTPQMASVSNTILGKVVGSCKESRNEIVASIDFLITGF